MTTIIEYDVSLDVTGCCLPSCNLMLREPVWMDELEVLDPSKFKVGQVVLARYSTAIGIRRVERSPYGSLSLVWPFDLIPLPFTELPHLLEYAFRRKGDMEPSHRYNQFSYGACRNVLILDRN